MILLACYFNIKLQVRIFFVLFTTLFSLISAVNFDCLVKLESDYGSGTGSIVNVNGMPYCLTAAHCVYDNNGSIYASLKVYRHDDGQETSITAGGDFVCEDDIVRTVNQGDWYHSDLQRGKAFLFHLLLCNSPKTAWELSAVFTNVDHDVTLIRLDPIKVGAGKFPTLITGNELRSLKNIPSLQLHSLVTFTGFVKGTDSTYYATEERNLNPSRIECGDIASFNQYSRQLSLKPIVVSGNSGSPIIANLPNGKRRVLGVVSSGLDTHYDNFKRMCAVSMGFLFLYAGAYKVAQEYEYHKLAACLCLGFIYNLYALLCNGQYLVGIPEDVKTSGILFAAYGSIAMQESFRLPKSKKSKSKRNH